MEAEKPQLQSFEVTIENEDGEHEKLSFKDSYYLMELRKAALEQLNIEPHRKTISFANDKLKDDMTLEEAKVVSGSIFKVCNVESNEETELYEDIEFGQAIIGEKNHSYGFSFRQQGSCRIKRGY